MSVSVQIRDEECLRFWWTRQRNAHHEHYPGIPPDPELDENLTPAQRREALIDFRLDFPQPLYECPDCLTVMSAQPAPLYKLNNVINELAPLDGEAAGPQAYPTADERPWETFFLD